MEQLSRQLSGRSALAVLVSITIGSGIFRVPRVVAAETGSVGGMMLCWIVGGIIALCAVLTLAELATMFPRAGGIYVYLREGYGSAVAFMFGWTELLALPLAQAAVALVFATYFGNFVQLGEVGTRLIAAALIVALGLVNYRSLRVAAYIQNVGTPAKVLALVVLSTMIFAFGHGGGAFVTGSIEYAPRSLGGFGVALVSVLFAYDGWAQFSNLSGEIRDPARTIPRVLVGALFLVIVVYLVVNAAYLYVVPVADIAASPIVAAEALRRAVGPATGSVVAALVMLSTFGTINSQMMAEPRLFYAMATDGLFFRAMSEVHPNYRTPHRAIVLTAALALFYVSFRSFEQLAESFVIATWPFFTLAVAGVLVLRRRRPDLARPYRTLGYPIVPLVFVMGGILIVGNALIQRPVPTLVSSAVTLLGWPVYGVWSRYRTRPAALPIGAVPES